jgi:hypothetical protein
MKKFYLFMNLVAVVMLVGLTNCKKEVLNPNEGKQYVGTVDGSFNVLDGDITFKSFPNAPTGVDRVWTMLRKDGTLVNGSEFIQGSAAQIWWSLPANNPVTFAANQAVYSNLTPLEDLRLITETKDGSGHVQYLGMLDFNPTNLGGQGFPLSVTGKRLGDVLMINTDELTTLPGAALTIKVAFNLSPIDLTATKKCVLGNGNHFTWSDIVYGTPVSTTVTAGSGDFVLYSGIDSKVFGNIVITINEAASSSTSANSYIVTIPANEGSGKGRLFKLHTNKLGWYDSAPINTTDVDISYETIIVTVN